MARRSRFFLFCFLKKEQICHCKKITLLHRAQGKQPLIRTMAPCEILPVSQERWVQLLRYHAVLVFDIKSTNRKRPGGLTSIASQLPPRGVVGVRRIR